MRRRPAPAVSARDGGWPRLRSALAATLKAALVLALALVPAGPANAARPSPTLRLTPVKVSIDRADPGKAVPQGFLGLSFELSNLRQIAGYADDGDLVTLLRSLGPGVLRFGGGSADTRVAWTDAATRRPAWASSVIDPEDLRELDVLAARSGWRILLTIGLAHFEPEAAAREAAAAKAALGASLEGIELGNEPNAFAQHGLREEPWTFVQYDANVSIYRSAIEALAPGIPLVGPDTSGSAAFESWGLGEAVDQRPALLTGHHYPLGCEQNPPPSIPRLLSPLIRRKEGASLAHYMAVAEAGDIPFRLDETNTVSCGGQAGISNTFASALWATGFLAKAMGMGLAGINLHGNPANCAGYSPVCAPDPEDLNAGVLTAQPEWYALLLTRALIGDRPLPTTASSSRNPNVEVRTFIAPDGTLQVVIVDDDVPAARPLAVAVHAGRVFQGASILRLTGPLPQALSGVLLGGRAVAADGSWTQPSKQPHAANKRGVITVEMTPGSAALLTVLRRAPE
jgi:hypothetical protein